AGGDVLELVGDHVDDLGEGGEGRQVIVSRHGLMRRDFERGALLVGAIDVGLEAEARGGKRQHAAQLAAAEYADGAAERERGSHPCGTSATLPVCSARYLVSAASIFLSLRARTAAARSAALV